jgi:tetratricopeptide (TPR) repeat protein
MRCLRLPVLLALIFILAACSSVNPIRTTYTIPNRDTFVRQQGAIDDIPAAYHRAKQNLLDGFLLQAIQGFELILAADPKHIEAKNGIAVVLAKSGQPNAAIAVLTKAIGEHPEAGHLRNNLGFTLYKAERYGEAETVFQNAVLIDPKNQPALENLALVKAHRLLLAQEPAIEAQPVSITNPSPHHGFVKVGDNLYILLAPIEPIAPIQKVRTLPAVLPIRSKVSAEKISRTARVVIVNGNGYTGQAKRYRDELQNKGFVISRTMNAVGFNHLRTRIEYLPGFEKQAKALTKLFPDKVILQRVAFAAHSEVRIILGRDSGKIRS